MITEQLTFDIVGAWVALTVILVHAVAFRRALTARRRWLLVVHTIACIGMAFAQRLPAFTVFASLCAASILPLFDDPHERRRMMIDLSIAIGVLVVGVSLGGLRHYAVLPGLFVGLAARLGVWPFGRWLDLPRRLGRAKQIALVLSGGIAWLAFFRHIPAQTLSELPYPEVFASVFAASAAITALSAGRNPLPVADYARAHVAVAIVGGVLFMGPRLMFDYGFATLVATTAVCVLIAGNYADGAYSLTSGERWVLALLVAICVGCPLTALFVDEDITLEGISFAHPLIAVAVAVVYVAAAVALVRFYFEQTRTLATPGLGRRRAGWVAPLLLCCALVLWGISPDALDPAEPATPPGDAATEAAP